MCLSSFGAGELVVSRHVEAICVLLGDANSNVRAAAMETLVDIYSHVGHKLRADLARRDISTAKMKVLLERFNEIDITTHTHNHSSDLEVCHREVWQYVLWNQFQGEGGINLRWKRHSS